MAKAIFESKEEKKELEIPCFICIRPIKIDEKSYYDEISKNQGCQLICGICGALAFLSLKSD